MEDESSVLKSDATPSIDNNSTKTMSAKQQQNI
jgi:hypothetical protein